MTPGTRPLSLLDLESLARDKLPQSAFDCYAGGADDELTLAENRAAWSQLRYRVLRDVSRRDLSVVLVGSGSSLPVVLAPTAFHRMAHPGGELATVRAAGCTAIVLTVDVRVWGRRVRAGRLRHLPLRHGPELEGRGLAVSHHPAAGATQRDRPP